MTTNQNGLKDLAERIGKIRRKKLFYTPDYRFSQEEEATMLTVGDAVLGKLMLVVEEVAEACKDIRKGNYDHFREEIADIFIRLLDICDAGSIDIQSEIERKVAINAERPPKHGKLTVL